MGHAQCRAFTSGLSDRPAGGAGPGCAVAGDLPVAPVAPAGQARRAAPAVGLAGHFRRHAARLIVVLPGFAWLLLLTGVCLARRRADESCSWSPENSRKAIQMRGTHNERRTTIEAARNRAQSSRTNLSSTFFLPRRAARLASGRQDEEDRHGVHDERRHLLEIIDGLIEASSCWTTTGISPGPTTRRWPCTAWRTWRAGRRRPAIARRTRCATATTASWTRRIPDGSGAGGEAFGHGGGRCSRRDPDLPHAPGAQPGAERCAGRGGRHGAGCWT